MPDSPPPETLAWLRQSAAVDGAAYSQVLLHLLERVEALEQRPIPGTVELTTPTPKATPVVTDEEQPLPPHIAITYQPKSAYQPLRPAQRPAAQPAPGIFPVEYADANGDGIRIVMEPAEETGQVCWVVRNSRHINACHEFSTPEAAYAAHQAAKAPAS
jgi:hypothetical protein